ncbi:hypothetical protein C2G38_2030218 [Gigaspora rosea]|uniref:Uncharacterized protein n=1 Tax=Gigaspora rosea TaxID=44941 RepID=A0A397VWV9_9GLOM|nr:hypothetical protein C2G38_2030218 [Gigaspora rosea]
MGVEFQCHHFFSGSAMSLFETVKIGLGTGLSNKYQLFFSVLRGLRCEMGGASSVASLFGLVFQISFSSLEIRGLKLLMPSSVGFVLSLLVVDFVGVGNFCC